jgi:hypothetical protein
MFCNAVQRTLRMRPFRYFSALRENERFITAIELIRVYRENGHYAAQLNPIQYNPFIAPFATNDFYDSGMPRNIFLFI